MLTAPVPICDHFPMREPLLSIVAARSRNGVIGRENRLPWHLPADLLHFKRITMGKPMIMGRRTWESLPGLLPGRRHIVITRDNDYVVEGGLVVHSIEEAVSEVSEVDEAMVIGGANLYAQMLRMAGRLYLTEIDVDVQGDAFFPPIDADEWREVAREHHSADEKNPYDYSFVILDRIAREEQR